MNNVTISKERIKELLSKALSRAWKGDIQRQTIVSRYERLNFCCPYCGDSKDPSKKRGNFYLKTLTFKCYNGGCIYSSEKKYRTLSELLQDFDSSEYLNYSEKSDIVNIFNNNIKKTKKIYSESNQYLITEELKTKLVRRTDLMRKLNLKEVINTPVGRYLEKRQQKPDKKFAADPINNRFFIFNMDPNNEYIFGLQIRNFNYKKGGVKYLTYKLSKIWSELMNIKDPIFLKSIEKIDGVSTLFGIFKSDLSKTFTIFEGPLDSFLFENSLALCSINNNFPFDLDNKRWFLDDDKIGKEKGLELIQNRESVFLWNKYKEENQIPNKIKDLNSLIIYLVSNSKKTKKLDNYFSCDEFDGIYL